ncbi:MAG: Ldh family oxidoreductase [Paraburkholderia sp.]|nr:Ldh family oxidoreductase [Paraburkholderia sp.]
MEVNIDDARRFATAVLTNISVPEDIAADVADHLIESDRVGYASHGLSILPNYKRVLAAAFVTADGRAERVVDRGSQYKAESRARHLQRIVLPDSVRKPFADIANELGVAPLAAI